MKKISKWFFAALAAGALLLAVASSANAQVAFGGAFGGPHGQFSFGIGSPAFAVGAYVPYPYAARVYLRPGFGYGFYYGSQWIPCDAYGSRWVVVQSPVYAYGYRGYGYRGYGYGGHARYYRTWHDYDRTWHDHDRWR